MVCFLQNTRKSKDITIFVTYQQISKDLLQNVKNKKKRSGRRGRKTAPHRVWNIRVKENGGMKLVYSFRQPGEECARRGGTELASTPHLLRDPGKFLSLCLSVFLSVKWDDSSTPPFSVPLTIKGRCEPRHGSQSQAYRNKYSTDAS